MQYSMYLAVQAEQAVQAARNKDCTAYGIQLSLSLAVEWCGSEPVVALIEQLSY